MFLGACSIEREATAVKTLDVKISMILKLTIVILNNQMICTICGKEAIFISGDTQ